MALTTRYVTSDGTGTWADATNSATPAPWATMLTDAVAGDLCKIFGSFTLGASSVMTASGTTTSPIILRGCGGTPASPLEGNQGRTGANGALVTTNMPVIAYDATFKLTTLTFTILESLNITTTAAAAAVTLGNNCLIKGCKIDNASNNAAASAVGAGTNSTMFDNDLSLSVPAATASVVLAGTLLYRVLCNRIEGGIGVSASNQSTVIFGNVIFSCTGACISLTHAGALPVVIGNTLVSSSTSAILFTSGSTQLSVILGNMITDNGAYGVNWVSAAGAGLSAYNRFRDNTSGNVNLGTDWNTATSYGEVTTDTGGPETDYTDSGTNDYTLISASPAKAGGWFSYLDIGALQRQEAGGGAARRFVQNL